MNMNISVYPYEKDGVVWGFTEAEKWPPGFGARVITDQYDQHRHPDDRQEEPYLKVGQVVYVESDEGDHLFVRLSDSGSFLPMSMEVQTVPIDKRDVQPVPNSLDAEEV